jgi:nitroimidazol reductase NimA-like FMN-containing flavoprotein (pyridoxamine 5'-phosphate oxidase superfamily)
MFEMIASDIQARLEGSLIGRLCMAGADGRPYAVPMPYCWRDGALYLRVPLSGRKGGVLAQNPQVCFEIDWHAEDLRDYGSLLVEGVLVEVSDMEEKGRVRATTAEKYDRLRRGFRPGHGRKTELSALAIRKIVVDRVSGRQKNAPSETEVRERKGIDVEELLPSMFRGLTMSMARLCLVHGLSLR